jgi:hypothetical protein
MVLRKMGQDRVLDCVCCCDRRHGFGVYLTHLTFSEATNISHGLAASVTVDDPLLFFCCEG